MSKMLELAVYDIAGKKVDTVKVDPAIFGGKVNKSVLREAVLMYQAAQRTGTSSAKNRSEVSGSRKKPFKQKGGGRARQGSWIAPQHIGGGVAHGPHPREFRYSIPKKAKVAALKSAYLDKLTNATFVLDSLKLDKPSTKTLAQLLSKLNVGSTCLIAATAPSESVLKSVRNIPGVTVKRIRDVNSIDLLRPRGFVVTRRALQSVIEKFSAEE